MELSQFETTKALLRINAKELLGKVNGTIGSISDNGFESSSSEWTARETAEHIYLVNQYILRKVEKLIGFLHEGLVNEESEYIESDLGLVETMLNVSIFKIKSLPEFTIPLNYSMEDLELKLAVQNIAMIKLIKSAPAALVNNYLTTMKVIPGIKLDVYQLIHFALKHMEHHLNQIKTLKSIEKALHSKVPNKREFLVYA